MHRPMLIRRVILVLIFGSSLGVGTPALAQSFLCEELPSCPDDGARPVGIVSPGCSCPRPASCPFDGFDYTCTFSIDSFSWFCSCDPFEVRRPDTPGPEPIPFDPPLGLCHGLLCNDGTMPTSDGFHCFCPDDQQP